MNLVGPAGPGSGWPDDPAASDTPVAHDPADVRELADGTGTLAELVARESVCRACPRLVEWREQVARVKRRAHSDEPYWGRPVAGWGDEHARILIVGLAPAAHGGNRTGRIFTGDRSGDVLFASLHRCGLAAQAASVRAGDGQQLLDTWVGAAVRCAPPANKPTVTERDACAPWLSAEIGGKTIPLHNREFVFNHTSKDATTYESPRRALAPSAEWHSSLSGPSRRRPRPNGRARCIPRSCAMHRGAARFAGWRSSHER